MAEQTIVPARVHIAGPAEAEGRNIVQRCLYCDEVLLEKRHHARLVTHALGSLVAITLDGTRSWPIEAVSFSPRLDPGVLWCHET